MAGAWRFVARLAETAKGISSPLRLGVRGLVIDRRNGRTDQILLVRHTYVAGWYLPGGGVEAKESTHAALARELEEEAGVMILGAPRLHGVFFNQAGSDRDHVVCFVVENFHSKPVHVPNLEIAEARFFSINALPEEATRATRARIDEVLRGAPVAEFW